MSLDSEILLEINIQAIKLLNVGRKQSLTRVLKVKLNKKNFEIIKRKYKINNRFKENQCFQNLLQIEDFERYFSKNNYTKIARKTIEFKIFNRKSFFLDKNLNKKFMQGMATLSIRFQVSEIVAS